MISDEKFPYREHILKSADFSKAYKEGASARSGAFVMHRRPNGLRHTRLGLSVGARKVKLAVRRNRIKRVLREAYRKNRPCLKKGLDIVVSVRRDPGKSISYKDTDTAFLKMARELEISA